MLCPRCRHEIDDDSSFCMYCGEKIIRCSNCGTVNSGDANYCTNCGTYLANRVDSSYNQSNYNEAPKKEDNPYNKPYEESSSYEEHNSPYYEQNNSSYEHKDPYQEYKNPYEDHDHIQDFMKDNEMYQHDHRDSVLIEEEKPKKVRWGIVIIAVLILSLATGASVAYLTFSPSINYKKDPTTNQQGNTTTTGDPTFTASKMTDTERFANLINTGSVACDGQYIYMTNDNGYLVKMTTDFKNAKVLVSSVVHYINVGTNDIYYTDASYRLCQVSKEGGDSSVLIETACYYVTYSDNKIYYQNDPDGESLYVYDLKTKKSTKLVNRHLYNLNIIGSKIYYSGADGVYCYDVNSKEDKLLASGKSYGVVYIDNYLFCLSTDLNLYRYSIKDNKTEAILSTSDIYSFIASDKALYYNTKGGKIYRLDLKTKETTTVFNGYLSNSQDYQVIGDQLLVKYNSHWYTVNTSDGSMGIIFK